LTHHLQTATRVVIKHWEMPTQTKSSRSVNQI